MICLLKKVEDFPNYDFNDDNFDDIFDKHNVDNSGATRIDTFNTFDDFQAKFDHFDDNFDDGFANVDDSGTSDDGWGFEGYVQRHDDVDAFENAFNDVKVEPVGIQILFEV